VKSNRMSEEDDELPVSEKVKELLGVAYRRRYWVILPAVMLSVIACCVAVLLPNLYRSSAVILVDPQKVPQQIVNAMQQGAVPERLALIRQEVLSPTRLKKLIDGMGLYAEYKGRKGEQEILEIMQRNISVETVDQGGVHVNAFRIVYSGKNPVTVAQVSNQLAGSFIEENLKDREQLSFGTAEFLDSELERTKRALDEKEQEVSKMKSQYLLDLPESKQYHIEALDSLRTQQRSLQDRLNRAQQEKLYLQSLMVTSAPTIDLDSSNAASPYSAQIQKLQTKLSDLESHYGPQHPEVRKAKAQLEDLQKRQDADKGSTQPPVVSENTNKKTNRNPVLESQLQRLDDEIAQINLQLKPLNAQTSAHISKLEQGPLVEQKMGSIMRDYETLRTYYSSLLNKKLNADTSSAMESRQKGERFVMLDPAQIPEKPYGPQRILIALAGILGGIAAGLGLAYVVEAMDDTVRTEREAIAITGLTSLSAMPAMDLPAEIRKRHAWGAAAVLATTIVSGGIGVAAGFIARRLM
jgi:polysaccharide biosynthesis transport protein